MNIALLEDEPMIASQLADFLTHSGHSITLFTDGESLVRVLRRKLFDLFILDWQVPKINGYEVLRYMRINAQMTEPVIFLTSSDSENLIVQALNGGADDYCVKPIRSHEFLARLASAQRRAKPSKAEPAVPDSFAGYQFDPRSKSVYFSNQEIFLTEKEFLLAHLFFSNLNRLISREKILLDIWGGNAPELSRTLDVHIAWIRKKLQIGGDGKVLRLATIYGYGYRLMQLNTNHE